MTPYLNEFCCEGYFWKFISFSNFFFLWIPLSLFGYFFINSEALPQLCRALFLPHLFFFSCSFILLLPSSLLSFPSSTMSRCLQSSLEPMFGSLSSPSLSSVLSSLTEIFSITQGLTLLLSKWELWLEFVTWLKTLFGQQLHCCYFPCCWPEIASFGWLKFKASRPNHSTR